MVLGLCRGVQASIMSRIRRNWTAKEDALLRSSVQKGKLRTIRSYIYNYVCIQPFWTPLFHSWWRIVTLE